MKMFSIHFVVYFYRRKLDIFEIFSCFSTKENHLSRWFPGDYYEKEKF
jgi:hypothetical protein